MPKLNLFLLPLLFMAGCNSKGKTIALKNIQKDAGEAIPFKKRIAGTWEWSWEGSNWGRESVAQKGVLEKTIIIGQDGYIAFYKNDTLVKKDCYTIHSLLRGNHIMELGDEEFSLWLEGHQLYMSIPWCVCGCLTNVYIR